MHGKREVITQTQTARGERGQNSNTNCTRRERGRNSNTNCTRRERTKLKHQLHEEREDITQNKTARWEREDETQTSTARGKRRHYSNINFTRKKGHKTVHYSGSKTSEKVKNRRFWPRLFDLPCLKRGQKRGFFPFCFWPWSKVGQKHTLVFDLVETTGKKRKTTVQFYYGTEFWSWPTETL